jgi:hypothetical protein
VRVTVGSLTGLVNFRDLGGWAVTGGGRTRHGVVFRSDSLSYATDADAAHLRHELRMRTIVDLRDLPEVAEFGRGPFARAPIGSAPIEYVSLPCGDVGVTSDTRPAYYVGVLERHGPAFAGLVRTLAAAPATPAVVHCHIGCDRTGTVAALLLGLAGVADDDICTDYARSSRASDTIRERSQARRTALGLPVMDRAYYDAWEPRADIMADTLALVAARWGDLYGWAATYGVTDADIAAWRTVFVDESVAS